MMNEDGFIILICMGGVGFLFLVVGILVRLGIWRAIYAVKGYPVYMPRELVCVGIPMALTVLSLWFVLVLPIAKETRGNLVMYVPIPLLIITYILAMWQPRWLKPAWLQWLEKEHGDIIFNGNGYSKIDGDGSVGSEHKRIWKYGWQKCSRSIN